MEDSPCGDGFQQAVYEPEGQDWVNATNPCSNRFLRTDKWTKFWKIHGFGQW